MCIKEKSSCIIWHFLLAAEIIRESFSVSLARTVLSRKFRESLHQSGNIQSSITAKIFERWVFVKRAGCSRHLDATAIFGVYSRHGSIFRKENWNGLKIPTLSWNFEISFLTHQDRSDELRCFSKSLQNLKSSKYLFFVYFDACFFFSFSTWIHTTMLPIHLLCTWRSCGISLKCKLCSIFFFFFFVSIFVQCIW